MKMGILITVRTGSTRLPGKALKKVGKKPVLQYLTERMVNIVQGRYEIVICTTDREEDQALKEVSDACKVLFFQGDAENIVKRHLDCAKYFGFDSIVNIDGDDIFCSPEYAVKIIEFMKENQQYDVVKSSHLPFGMNCMGYRITVLQKVLEVIMSQEIDTGWGQLINNRDRFNIYEFPAVSTEILDVRLSLDYQEDFDLFKAVIEGYLKANPFACTCDIIGYIRSNPHLIKINSHLNEIYWENYNTNKVKEGR